MGYVVGNNKYLIDTVRRGMFANRCFLGAGAGTAESWLDRI